MKRWLSLIFFALVLGSCARVGSPVGGARDTIAPKFVKANIDSTRINVPTDLRELRLEFNELITLRDISRNLTITPEIRHIKRILPSNLGNRYILIRWEEDLQPNTTYSFNFGNAIADLNEGNALPYFNFAFSTGPEIDNLYISGEVSDAMKGSGAEQRDPKSNIVVGLYPETAGRADFTKKPYYITRADPDGYFELSYLAEGRYRILAFNDENQNSAYDAGKESVAFLKSGFDLNENISGMKLSLMPVKKRLRFSEAREVPGGILMLFEGGPEQVEISPEDERLTEYKTTHRTRSDSVRIWFDAQAQNLGQGKSENLKFRYRADTLSGTASIFYRMSPKNEMTLQSYSGGSIHPENSFEIVSNYEIHAIDTQKWTLKSDSINQQFTAEISPDNPFKILVKSQFEPSRRWQLDIPKGSVRSYYESPASSYRFEFETARREDFGTITFQLKNAPDSKFWFQLLDERFEPVYSQFTQGGLIKFSALKPGRYTARILVDNDGNGVYDYADFQSGTPAEDVYIYKKPVEIRALWEMVETWDLRNDEKTS